MFLKAYIVFSDQRITNSKGICSSKYVHSSKYKLRLKQTWEKVQDNEEKPIGWMT